MTLTIAHLDHMESDDRWEGFGYLGERRNQRLAGRGTEAADIKALRAANAAGLDYQGLFAWANSKDGRWYGDCMFGANERHAEKYLPGTGAASRRRAEELDWINGETARVWNEA